MTIAPGLEKDSLTADLSLQARDRFLPSPDSFRKTDPDVPLGFGVEGSAKKKPDEYVRVEEREMNTDEMADLFSGDLMECNDTNIEQLKEMWLSKFKTECPYDFDDMHDREINYQIALTRFEESFFSELSKDRMKVDPLKSKEDLPIYFDLEAIRHKGVSDVLNDLGGEQFVDDIWCNCQAITLKRPSKEGQDWVVILQAWNQDWEESHKRMAMSLGDFQRMLVLDEERQVKLPLVQSGSVEEKTKFKMALSKVKRDGISMPDNMAVFVEDWADKDSEKAEAE